MSLHWNWLDCKRFSQPECQRQVQQQSVFSQMTLGLSIQRPWKAKLADGLLSTQMKQSFVPLQNIRWRILFFSCYHSTLFWPKNWDFQSYPPGQKWILPVFFFFAGMLHGNICPLLQGCNYSLYISPYKRNRVCSASKNYLALLLTGFSSSPANKASLAQQGFWHSQPSHYRPSFPVPHVENNPKADWGMGFQELLPWWGSPLMKKT